MFARRLYNIDRIIDINANAQKTPVLVLGNEKQRLTLLNLYKEYDGIIFGDKNLDINALKALSTNAPYVCDKLYQLKTQIWNEALTYLGISNINIQKKERLITDEVTRNQGGTIASRYSRLETRRQAVEKINEMLVQISKSIIVKIFSRLVTIINQKIQVQILEVVRLSKYTTEVRYICETDSGLDESVGFNSVDEVISKSWNKIFTSKVPFFDEDYRKILCCKILKHYYLREICSETVGLWKLWVNTKLEEIMPYYNQFMKVLS